MTDQTSSFDCQSLPWRFRHPKGLRISDDMSMDISKEFLPSMLTVWVQKLQIQEIGTEIQFRYPYEVENLNSKGFFHTLLRYLK